MVGFICEFPCLKLTSNLIQFSKTTIYKNKKHYQPINHPQRIFILPIFTNLEKPSPHLKNPASAVEPNGPTYLVSLHRKLIRGPPFHAPLPDLASLNSVNALATTLTTTSDPTAIVSWVCPSQSHATKLQRKISSMFWTKHLWCSDHWENDMTYF